MKTKEQIAKELDAPIPRSIIRERPGGNGRPLSYLEGHYVIDRLNKVLGIGNWSHRVKELKALYVSTQPDEKGRHNAAYSAIVEIEIRFSGSGSHEYTFDEISFSDVGYGDGMDKLPTKCHELAMKEAVTDGIKRAAKSLGMSMGLALYSKEQENVIDDEEEVQPAPVARPEPKATEEGTRKVVSNTGTKGASTNEKEERAKVMETTGAQARVLCKVKGYTLDQVKELVSTQFGGRARADLTVEELNSLSTTLESLISKEK